PTQPTQQSRDAARKERALQDRGLGTVAPPRRDPTVPAVPPIARVASPVIAIPSSLDFGFLSPGQDASGIVVIKNNGEAPVTIVTAKAGCKCTTINSLDGTMIASGATADLNITLTGAEAQGIRRASVVITFANDVPPLTIPLQGEVALPIRSIPPYVNLVGGGSSTGRLVIEANDGTPFSLCAVNGEPPVVSGGYNPATDAPRPRFLLEYNLSDATAIPTYLLIETNRPDCPLVDVKVRHESTLPRATLKMSNYRQNLGAMVPGVKREFMVQLLENTEVRSVVSASPFAEATLVSSTFEGKGTEVVVSIVLKEEASGLVRFPIVLVTESKQQELECFVIARKSGESCGVAPTSTPGG
ncbi:MAG: DUF1573 domain-containing protein, partial [Planctomycetota bacterium]|nr:DUF1573 domain-containing protein [Planctomycetota bacterium]